MKSTRSSLSSAKGFTIAELLVASFMGLLLLAVVLSAVQMNRYVFGRDTIRTRLNENLRGAMDILTADGRIAGENLGSTFPAVKIVDGGGTNSDQLYLRRGQVDEILKVCTAITAGSTTSQIYFAITGNVQGCTYTGATQSFTSWRDFRTANGGQVKAYIYDLSAKVGEFFTYYSETDTGSTYYIQRTAGTWAHAYPATSSAVYLLEEWRYVKNSDLLQVIQNEDSANPYNISFGISGFNVEAVMQDGTTKTSFSESDSWTQISLVKITLKGQDSFAKETIERTLIGQFFPRNVLSY